MSKIHETSIDGPVKDKRKHRITVWLKEGEGREQTKSVVEIYEWPIIISKKTGKELRSTTPEAVFRHYREMWGERAVLEYQMMESVR